MGSDARPKAGEGLGREGPPSPPATSGPMGRATPGDSATEWCPPGIGTRPLGVTG